MNRRFLVLLAVIFFVLQSCNDNEICFDSTKQLIIASDVGFHRLYIENDETNTVFQVDKRQGLKASNEFNLMEIDTTQYEILKLGVKQKKCTHCHLFQILLGQFQILQSAERLHIISNFTSRMTT